MLQRSSQSKPLPASPPVPSDPGLRIPTTNENWRGKNDPAERRRIQNRLNQRAFRERQRAGESTKEYNSRDKPAASKDPRKKSASDSEKKQDRDTPEDESEDEDEDDEDPSDEEEDSDSDESDDAEQSNPGSPPGPSPAAARPHFTGQIPRAACTPSTPSTENPWDELAQLINRNFMQAATTNAQHLGVGPASLRAGTVAVTPRQRNGVNLPPTLKPVELQHQLLHDPIIDTIPHARLRFNILRAIATGNLDATRFSASLRRSGAVLNVQNEPRRSGLIVWNFPEQLASWELSEAFVMTWAFLLEGCEDFVAATNAWRNRRGERALVVASRSSGR